MLPKKLASQGSNEIPDEVLNKYLLSFLTLRKNDNTSLEDFGGEGGSWTTLKVHEDDHSLNGSHGYCTFSITDCVSSFRYLRIVQTGIN